MSVSGDMHILAAGGTDVGQHRKNNEDAFALVEPAGPYVVADGMGGHCAGEHASRIAVDAMKTVFVHANASRTPDMLRSAVSVANLAVIGQGERVRAWKGMGTTVVALLFTDQARRASVAHVGDSRCYRLRAGVLEQLTRDHSLVGEYEAVMPNMTSAQRAALPSNYLTRSVGQRPDVAVDLSTHATAPGDLYLLCSDGLTNMVPDAELTAILRATSGFAPAAAVRALIDRANEHGGDDNITAVVARVLA